MKTNSAPLRVTIKSFVVLTISIWGLTATAGELGKQSQFLSAPSKTSETEKFRFFTLASLAKLSHQADLKSFIYPTSFEFMASDAKLDRAILLGSKRVSADLADQIFEVPGGIFAPISLDKKPASVIFVGFSLSEVKSIVKNFRETYVADSSTFAGGRAPASEVVQAIGTGEKTGSQNQNDNWEYTYALGRSFAKCGLGVGEGFNAVTIDPVVSAAKSAKYLVTNTRQWIANSIDEVRRLKDTLITFDDFARKQWADWKSKPPEEKSRIYCSFLGGGVGMKTLVKGTEQLVAKAATKVAAPPRSATGEIPVQAVKEIEPYRKGAAPGNLSADVQAIVQPNAPYIGKTWWEYPAEGSSAYPYLADRTNLKLMKAMNEKPLPDVAKFDPLKDYGWKNSVETLKGWPSTATQKIDEALASADIAIDGQKFVLVNGSKFGNSRLVSAADFKPTTEIRNNGLTGQRVFADNGKFRSISSPAIEYQGNGMNGYSTKAPRIQGAPVRIVTEAGMIEGRYLSSAGPGIARGAEITQLSAYQQKDALAHLVQVGDQTVLVSAKGAEIFAQY